VVISGAFGDEQDDKVTTALRVEQITLAEILDWQSREAFAAAERKRLWNEVRTKLIKGATIEEGPIKAWLEKQFILVRGKKRSARTVLRVI
jgi:hypothetical protein